MHLLISDLLKTCDPNLPAEEPQRVVYSQGLLECLAIAYTDDVEDEKMIEGTTPKPVNLADVVRSINCKRVKKNLSYTIGKFRKRVTIYASSILFKGVLGASFKLPESSSW